MSEGPPVTRRPSGRDARRAERAAPLPDHLRPVRPGMTSGRYQPLGPHDIEQIHATSLRLLAEVGLADATESGAEIMTRAGCQLSAQGRLLFPRSLVEDTLAKAARNFVLHAQDPRHDLEPSGKRAYFGTAGAAVNIVDAQGVYRESTIQDLYDIGRVVDVMEHIHFFQRAVVPRDIPDPFEMDFNTCYAAVSSTTKHIGSSWVQPEHVTASLEMLHLIAGGERQWRERPFVSQSNCFVVPPMKFAADACRCLEVAVRGGMPVLLLSAGQAGATAPAALAGALAQEVAEVLAGLVYVNAIKAGHPAIFGTWCFVSDLRTGAMSGGSPEQALLSAAAGQMANYYNLTGGTASGMTDSKVADGQSGAEKALNHALVGNSGANLIYESAGMHASLLGYSLESLIIDNDIIGAAQRTIKGIEVNEERLSFETIKDVCLNGPGHYLGSDQTLQLMQTEYLYPGIADRRSPNDWAERGSLDVLQRAADRIREILSSHYPHHVPDSIDAAIRARFPVRLDRAGMRPRPASPAGAASAPASAQQVRV
ncbi:MAG TPA: trimethylamine methyltransferase family protein [Steroidobacteraceae bacterium]|nr:trimethylamine methyltransferase family protein [Steroidobacteraceae bacterium]